MTDLRVSTLKQQALDLFRRNLKSGYDPYFKRAYRYVCPSPERYPWQWFWDSCFHAVTLCHLDLELAKNELLNLVASQSPDGFIGHVIFWKGAGKYRYWTRLESRLALRPHHTATIQPPVLAQAVQQVYERSQDEAFLRAIVPNLVRYYRWLAEHRDPDADGLISVISSFETGLDHLPAYDEIMGISNGSRPGWWLMERKVRGLALSHLILGRNYNLSRVFALDRFNLEDVMVNCVYAEALGILAGLASRVGLASDAQQFADRARRVEDAILQKCYDQETGAFFSIYKRRETKARVLTVISLFPLLLSSTSKEVLDRLVKQHLLNAGEFWLPYPVPSVARSEPSFNPNSYATPRPLLWRGPTWMNMNWFLVRGLRRHGYGDVAQHIADRSLGVVAREGFREYYNPFTGEGLGAANFGWSTLVLDMV